MTTSPQVHTVMPCWALGVLAGMIWLSYSEAFSQPGNLPDNIPSMSPVTQTVIPIVAPDKACGYRTPCWQSVSHRLEQYTTYVQNGACSSR